MKRKLESQLKSSQVERLYKAVALLKSEAEAADFLRDILTLDEILEASRRLEVAKLLREGISVRKIAKATGVSSATITRINYWLHYGMGGYGLALEKLT